MQTYSQKDIRWSWRKLGWCNTTFAQNGCCVTCLAMLTGKTPLEVNDILKAGGGFVNGCDVWWQKACNLLGLEWYGIGSKPAFYPTIAKVRMANGATHFVLALSNNRIVDPLDGKEKGNVYPIVEYRNVKAPQAQPEPQPTPAPEPQPVQNTNPYPCRVKVIAKPALMVRTQPNTHAPLGGDKRLPYGTIITVTGEVSGERVNGNDKWYVTIKNNYVSAYYCQKVA